MREMYVNAASLYSDAMDIKTLIPDANARRRMSRIVKMGVAAGRQALADAGIDTPDAIITATGYGCVADSEKFLRSIIDSDEATLSPTPFIQSTFNTIGSQLALLTACEGYNMTYVNRFSSFDNALLDAAMAIGEGAANVLVGAADELTPAVTDILTRLGAVRRGAPLAEGAAFFLLSAHRTDATLATLTNIDICSQQPADITADNSSPIASAVAMYNAVSQLRSMGERKPLVVGNGTFRVSLV